MRRRPVIIDVGHTGPPNLGRRNEHIRLSVILNSSMQLRSKGHLTVSIRKTSSRQLPWEPIDETVPARTSGN